MTQTIKTLMIAFMACSLIVPNMAAARTPKGDEVIRYKVKKRGSDIQIGVGIGIVNKPIDEVYKVVTDYGNYKHFMPYFTKSKVLSRRGNNAMLYNRSRDSERCAHFVGQHSFE